MGIAGRRTVTALVLTAMLMGGCGESGTVQSGRTASEVPTVPKIDTDVAALRPPGSDVADGVRVPVGTMLVGQAFPTVEYEQETGWSALFVVTGDPIEVWNDVVQMLSIPEAEATFSCVVSVERVAQDEGAGSGAPMTTALASAVGVGGIAPSATGSTTSVREGESSPTSTASIPGFGPAKRFLTEPQLPGENRLTCAFVEGRFSARMIVGAQLGCKQEQGPGRCDLRAVSHLLVSRKSDANSGSGSRGTDGLRYNRAPVAVEGPAGETVTVPLPPGSVKAPQIDFGGLRSDLPTPGERLDGGLDYFLPDTFVVPAGGTSLVAPAMLIECNSGLVAVVRVPLSAGAAIAWLDDSDPDDDPVVTVTGNRSEQPWVAGTITTAGGYYLYATAVQNGSESDVFITECGD